MIPLFPVDHAYRYAAALRDGRVELVEDAYAFTPEDQPQQFAHIIDDFVSAT